MNKSDVDKHRKQIDALIKAAIAPYMVKASVPFEIGLLSMIATTGGMAMAYLANSTDRLDHDRRRDMVEDLFKTVHGSIQEIDDEKSGRAAKPAVRKVEPEVFNALVKRAPSEALEKFGVTPVAIDRPDLPDIKAFAVNMRGNSVFALMGREADDIARRTLKLLPDVGGDPMNVFIIMLMAAMSFADLMRDQAEAENPNIGIQDMVVQVTTAYLDQFRSGRPMRSDSVEELRTS